MFLYVSDVFNRLRYISYSINSDERGFKEFPANFCLNFKFFHKNINRIAHLASWESGFSRWQIIFNQVI